MEPTIRCASYDLPAQDVCYVARTGGVVTRRAFVTGALLVVAYAGELVRCALADTAAAGESPSLLDECLEFLAAYRQERGLSDAGDGTAALVDVWVASGGNGGEVLRDDAGTVRLFAEDGAGGSPYVLCCTAPEGCIRVRALVSYACDGRVFWYDGDGGVGDEGVAGRHILVEGTARVPTGTYDVVATVRAQMDDGPGWEERALLSQTRTTVRVG